MVEPNGLGAPAGRQENFGRSRRARLSLRVVPVRRTDSIRSRSGAGRSGARDISWYGSQAPTTTGALTWRPSASATPLTAPPSTHTRFTGAPATITAPAARAASAKVADTVPMPPLAIIQVPSAPGSRHILCTRKLCPVPASSGPALRPDSPSVTAYMETSSSESNSKRAR
jgi:hypothetical protein